MPIDHSPVKTRANSKVSSKVDKAEATQQSLSDSSLSEPDKTPATVLAAVETALNNVSTIGRLVELVASKVAQSVNDNIALTLQQTIAEIATLKSELVAVQDKLKCVESDYGKKLDELEQYQRRNNLRVFGVKELEGEDTDGSLINLFRDQLGVDVTKADIDRSHRVGRISQPDEHGVVRPRPIIIKFVSYRTRRQVFTNKKKLKGSAVSIREDLTPRRLGLLKDAVAAHGARNVWTMDGRILWVDANGSKGRAS